MANTTIFGQDTNKNLAQKSICAPVGEIFFFAKSTPPEHALACDGAAVSRAAYPELFGAIGTTFGSGDGSTTFNLPDLRGRWMMGADAERAAGEEVAEGLPNITGEVSAIYANTRGQYNGALYMIAISSGTEMTTPGDGSVGLGFNAHNSNAIYGAQSHVTPASVAVLPCIVYE